MSLTNLSFLGVYFPLLMIAYYNPFFKSNTFKKILLLGSTKPAINQRIKYRNYLSVNKILVNKLLLTSIF